jgi:hypothetical protein
MNRLAGALGSSESSDVSERAVAAQMPPIRIKIQNGLATADTVVNATTANPAETTSMVADAARKAAPSTRGASVRRSLALKAARTPKAASATGTTGSRNVTIA